MYKTKKVHVAQLQDKTVQGAKEFIETVEMEAGIVLYQIESNDLSKKKTAIETLKQVNFFLHTVHFCHTPVHFDFVNIQICY
jgi:predicted secreted acid phosphatase